MLRFVDVKGKDAAEFLQRVTAGTVKGLAPGSGRAGLLLNGQSRVLAQFDLLRTADGYRLAAPVECAGSLAEDLEALHFAEDLTITLTDSYAVAEAQAVATRGDVFAFAETWPSPVPGFLFRASPAPGAAPAGWDFARIGALVPWPGTEWKRGENPALEAGMLPWIDRFKGCYPGQEVVELSLNVGHPVRVLVAVEGERAPAWEGVTVTSAAAAPGVWRGIVRLAWAKRENLPSGISRLAGHW